MTNNDNKKVGLQIARIASVGESCCRVCRQSAGRAMLEMVSKRKAMPDSEFGIAL